MCGILMLVLRQTETIEFHGFQELVKLIEARGPEYKSELDIETKKSLGIKLISKASVLSFRSAEVQWQPIKCEVSKDMLLFNGQIFCLLEGTSEVSLESICDNTSDVKYVFDRLSSCRSAEQVVTVLCKIRGPFAFVYWKESLGSLFYGRDIFGRRSLCVGYKQNCDNPCAISSVGPRHLCSPDITWSEVSPKALHQLDYTNFKDSSAPRKKTYAWDIESIFPCSNESHGICESNSYNDLQIISTPLRVPLNKDLKVADDECKYVNEAQDANEELSREFEKVLVAAVRRRVENKRVQCLDCRIASASSGSSECSHASVAVAFSGGIDSTLLALLLDKVLADKRKPIDLINVAFGADAPDRLAACEAFEELARLAAGRRWNLICCDVDVNELQACRSAQIRHLISPLNTVLDDSLGSALWFAARGTGRLIESSRQPTLGELFELAKYAPPLVPLDTAARCDSTPPVSCGAASYATPASLLFVGMGIDEQLGGYSSHRRAYARAGLAGVFEEVSTQMRRLACRNSGRDDRVCASFGRDVRTPYLDEALVDFLNAVPLRAKMRFDDNCLGPKRLLRQLALSLGLQVSGRQVKRAMQFGTRIAKLESRSERGSQECSRL